MSMNLNVKAEREVVVVKTGEKSSQRIKFSLWQTPTNVTYNILEAKDIKQAYVDWVMSRARVEQVPVYAVGDVFCENDPIGFEEVNSAQDHVNEFLEWVSKVEKEGYEIEFYEM